MKNNYKFLAIISFVLFMAAFACFLLGLRHTSSEMIGISFVLVSLTLAIGAGGNWYFSTEQQSEQQSNPTLQTAAATPTTGSPSRPTESAVTDPTDMIISTVFGGIALLFLGAGIWFWLYGSSFLF